LKNILIISAVFPPEPVVSSQLSNDLAHSLKTLDNNITVLCPPPSRPMGFKFPSEKYNYPFNVIHSNTYTCAASNLIGRLKESYFFGKFTQAYINQNAKEIDIIYANTWPLFAQYFSVKAAKKNKTSIIIHVQDVYPESLGNKIPLIGKLINWILLPLDKYILQNAYKVIAISEKMKQHLVNTRSLSKNKCEVVLNWQDERDFISYLPEKKTSNDIFTFMYLGNIGPVAGVDLLIKAFAKAQLRNCQLIIAGSGSSKADLQKLVQDKKYANILFWEVPAGKVPETQSKADVMLLPLKKGTGVTSIPSKLPAYMFSKKPVIACVNNNSDTGNCILNSNGGWITEPENEEALAVLMQKVSNLPKQELQTIGENSFQFAIRYLSRTANLKRLTDLILN